MTCLFDVSSAYTSVRSHFARNMNIELQDIENINASIAGLDFKNSGIFANSLLKTTDTTQIIRDIRDEEVVFFQGKKMIDIDYELINNSGFSTSDGFAQHELYKLLEDEIDIAHNLNEKFDSLIPPELKNQHEYAADIESIKSIYKRTYIINKIWASRGGNMLDHETNQMLENTKTQMNELLETLKEVSDYQKLLKIQKQELNQSYENKEG